MEKTQKAHKGEPADNPIPAWFTTPANRARLSENIFSRICRASGISNPDLVKIRTTIRGYVEDSADEQQLRDYLETFDQRSVMAGASVQMMYLATYSDGYECGMDCVEELASDPAHAGAVIGFKRPVGSFTPLMAAALLMMVRDVLAVPKSDLNDALIIAARWLRNVPIDQLIQSESLDARAFDAGALLLLAFFEYRAQSADQEPPEEEQERN